MENNVCKLCHSFVKRVDSHPLTVHGDFLTAHSMQLIKHVYRFRECSGSALKCYTCNRRFISKSTYETRCSGPPKRLENHRNITSRYFSYIFNEPKSLQSFHAKNSEKFSLIVDLINKLQNHFMQNNQRNFH